MNAPHAIPPQVLEPHIRVDGVHKLFETGGRTVTALQDIDLDIPRGQFTCLLGPSGCGKSTLLNAVAGFSLPSSGTITVDGNPVTAPGPDRGMVFQEYALFPWMTVEDNIAFGLHIKGLGKTEIRARVGDLLGMLSLSDFRQRFPKDLSGGMRQRVAIARAFAVQPEILLADESFSALDEVTAGSLRKTFVELAREFRSTAILITHQLEEAMSVGDRIVVFGKSAALLADVRMADWDRADYPLLREAIQNTLQNNAPDIRLKR